MNEMDWKIATDLLGAMGKPHKGKVISRAQVIEMWQLMINDGLAWHLSKAHAKTAKRLLKAGFCIPPEDQGGML